MELLCRGKPLVPGEAEGALLAAPLGLSFWGGVDALSSRVIDRHHPLHRQEIARRMLAIPGGRGSCSGSGVLLELLLANRAPAAIIVREPEEILTLGVLVAEMVFDRSIPVLQLSPEDFSRLDGFGHARIAGDRLQLFAARPSDGWARSPPQRTDDLAENLDGGPRLEAIDRALLAGDHGEAACFAMRLLLRMAALQQAEGFLDVAQVHVDGCIYTGPACLAFARRLVEWGARVRVPTTLNAISVDHRRWRAQGVDEARGAPAAALADAYLAMGARPSFTCAPYLLDSAPAFGEQIGWAESNAVVYANSVLGARTMKYPDYLDICVALTGRAPRAGCHLDAGRQATLALEVELPVGADDAVWPLLGYCCGSICGGEIPLLLGLEASAPGPDDLKAFGAAFATTAAAPMFHIAGVTPEAAAQRPSRRLRIGRAELHRAWTELDTGASSEIELVSLGNPHFSPAECARLAALLRGRRKGPGVAVIVTCGRDVYDVAARAGHVAAAEAFGVQFVTDTCWCMLGEPVIPPAVRTLMTNSAKYAHYGPGLVGRGVRFGSLAACVAAACSGRAEVGPPAWLMD